MPRTKKALLILFGLFLFYTLAGFLLLPPVIRYWVFPKVMENLNADLQVTSIRTNPFTWSLTLREVSLSPTGQDEIFGFKTLYVRLRPTGFLKKTFHFHTIDLESPKLSVTRSKDGSIDWMQIFPESNESQTPESAPRQPLVIPLIAIDSFQIRNGMISYRDDALATPFSYTLTPLNLSLENLNTRPDSANPYRITAMTQSGESFSWEGHFSFNPLSSAGTITVQQFIFRHYMPLLEKLLPLHFNEGTLDLSLDYRFDPLREQITIGNGKVRMTNLQLKDPNVDTTVQSLKHFQLSPFSLDLYAGKMEIGTISLQEGFTLLERNPQGRLNWPEYVLSVTNGNTESDESEDEEETLTLSPQNPDLIDVLILAQNHLADLGDLDWDLQVHRIECQDWDLQWLDQALSQPFDTRIRLKNFVLESFSNRENAESTFQFEIAFPEESTLQVQGQLKVSPPSLDFDYHLSKLPLNMSNPYMAGILPIAIESGKLSASGWANVLPHQGELPIAASATFDVWIDSLSISDTSAKAPLFSSLLLGGYGVQIDTTTMELQLREVKVDDFAAHLRRLTDGTLQLPIPATDPAPPAESSPQADSHRHALKAAQLNLLTLHKGRFIFTDQSVTPEAKLTVEQIELSAKNLTWPEIKDSDFKFSILLNRQGKLEGNGNVTFTPSILSLQALIRASTLPMTAFSPYASHFVGVGLKGGTLNFELNYKVETMTLSAGNRVIIEKLDFGEKSGGDPVFKLPIQAAVMLLEDRNRRILLNVPVSGDLRDPEFDFSDVIVTAFVNVLTNVITAPFNIIGNLFGGGAVEHLERIDFAPGAVALDEVAREKLSILAKALYERPGLRIVAEGSYSKDADGAVLKQQLLLSEWAHLALKENADSINPWDWWNGLSQEERHRWLRQYTVESGQANAAEPDQPQGQPVQAVRNSPTQRDSHTTYSFYSHIRGSRRGLQNKPRQKINDILTVDTSAAQIPVTENETFTASEAEELTEESAEPLDEATWLARIADKMDLPLEEYQHLAKERALACLDYIRQIQDSVVDRFIVSDQAQSTGTTVNLSIDSE